MKKLLKNKQRGFIELIIVIVIALLLMNYYGLTFRGIFEWFKGLFLSVW